MKKLWIALLGLGLALLLCGCTESAIDCGVDRDNRAFLRYDLKFDLSSLSEEDRLAVRGWLQRLSFQMKHKQGFSVDTNAARDEEQIYLKAELIRRGSNRTEALAHLRDMLTDETLTPFTLAACEGEAQQTLETARVLIRLEPDRVLETLGLEYYPKQVRAQVEQWLDTATLRVSLRLPATQLPEGETAELRDGLAEKTLRLPLRGSGELSLSTVYYTGEGDYGQVWWGGEPRTAADARAMAKLLAEDEAKLQRKQDLLLYAGICLAALALLFFLLGTVRRRRQKNAQCGALSVLPEEAPAQEACPPSEAPEEAAGAMAPEEAAAPEAEYVENMCLHPAEDSRIIEAAIKETAGAPSQDVDSPRDPAQENGGISHD